ncbi:MAG: hypothetical protein GTN49_11225 [candidate division Zixibacteria bacterium]|nr:hypothetical protein [candidate division Zixibacteria bacterium]
MAFIRFKGPYAYLVENERCKAGDKSYVRQRVLYYLGREPTIDDGVIAEVERRFPEIAIDWQALREEVPAARPGGRTLRRRLKDREKRKREKREDDWLDWD